MAALAKPVRPETRLPTAAVRNIRPRRLNTASWHVKAGGMVMLLAASIAVGRIFFDSAMSVDQGALAGAVVVISIIVGTGGRPGLILGSSVEREGQPVANLLWRRRFGWAAAAISVLDMAAWIGVGLEERGGSRIFFLRPIRRIGRQRVQALLEGLRTHPVLGTEVTAILKGRSRKQ